MRIGIITLWQSSDNYGQQLQCWALQQQLLKMGHEPYLIRYDIDHRSCQNQTSIWRKLLKVVLVYPFVKSIKSKIRRIKEKGQNDYVLLKNKERHFDSFRMTELMASERLYTNLKELRDNPPKADAYIVGSDQVWAHLLSNAENEAMFLGFGDKTTKRIAYAPSFSMPDYPQQLKDALKRNLTRFDALSVREQTGLAICRGLGFDAKVVLDPTMLLVKDDYAIIKETVNDERYIYLYFLNISKQCEVEWRLLKECAQSKGLEIVATPASGYFIGKELFEDVEYKYATIPQWIGLIDGAQLVVTTSFHGVVFCVLHHTPFVYFPLKGKYSRGNNRVVDLCDMLHLSERIWNDESSFETLINSDIDWKNVDGILNERRNASIDYLKEALSLN